MNNQNSNKTITPGTIIRTVTLALALCNQILTASGHSVIPIDNDTITQLITAGFTVVSAIVAFWKNNSFTKSAIKADEHMRDYKGKQSE